MDQVSVIMKGITKRFGQILANDDISFEVKPGEIHGLLGENGAGKTTLMNILFGHHLPDLGSITINSKEVIFQSPRDAIQYGIGMVHQHFSLVPTFTVAENVILGYTKDGQIQGHTRTNLRTIQRDVQDAATHFGMPLDAGWKTGELPVGIQQQVEILKILYRGARLLILDEPTSLLGPAQITSLFDILADLRTRGYSIVIVTHKLREIMQLTDRITILRRGSAVLSGLSKEFTEEDLTSSMTGHVIHNFVSQVSEVSPKTELVLELRDVSVHSKHMSSSLNRINLKIHSSEIVGVAGVQGNGQRELVDLLLGLLKRDEGYIYIYGKPVNKPHPWSMRALGIAVVPEDRQKWGLLQDMNLSENVQVCRINSGLFSRLGFLDWPAIHTDAEERLKRFDVRPPNPKEIVARLSGGNQQKVILAREIADDVKLLMVHNPTWGLDVAATSYVHSQLIEFKNRGGAVLLLSLDLDEILGLADRIVVMYRGTFVMDKSIRDVSVEELGAAMAGCIPDVVSENPLY